MKTSRKGTAAENHIGGWLQEHGWMVGSRRHIKGPGDWLATHPTGAVWLIEVKGCKNLWDNFRPDDRKAMTEAKAQLPPGAEVWVVNVVGTRKELVWVPESRWP